MVNNKTTVTEVMNTIYQIDSILKKNTETLWQTVDRERVSSSFLMNIRTTCCQGR